MGRDRLNRSLQSPRVTTFAAVTGTLPKLGVVVVAVVAASSMLLGQRRARALTMLGALVLAPVLLLADIWHSPQLHIVHRHPLEAVIGAAVGIAVIAALGFLIHRHPTLLAPLVVIALPFRVPIQAGGATSNLLVPLYLVVAAGSLAVIVPALVGAENDDDDGDGAPRPAGLAARLSVWLPRMLGLAIVLYGVQSVYSPDFEKALQQTVFFYVPFALLFGLLRGLEWTPQLIQRCVVLIVGLSLLFAAVGFAEYATKTLFLNPKLIAANDAHTYFTVNSVFFDPDIFGRFLAIVMIIVTAVLLYRRSVREQLAATAVLAILWCALVLTLSRSSLGRTPRRSRHARRRPLARDPGARRRARRRRHRRGRDRHLAEDVRAQPGRERRLERAREPRHRRHRPVRRATDLGVRLGLVQHASTAVITTPQRRSRPRTRSRSRSPPSRA